MCNVGGCWFFDLVKLLFVPVYMSGMSCRVHSWLNNECHDSKSHALAVFLITKTKRGQKININQFAGQLKVWMDALSCGGRWAWNKFVETFLGGLILINRNKFLTSTRFCWDWTFQVKANNNMLCQKGLNYSNWFYCYFIRAFQIQIQALDNYILVCTLSYSQSVCFL